jgi:hypothetical protein
MNKILVHGSKKTQHRVLRICNGLNFNEIQFIINSIYMNDPRFNPTESQKIYIAYQNGWRGNDADNVKAMIDPSKKGFFGKSIDYFKLMIGSKS